MKNLKKIVMSVMMIMAVMGVSVFSTSMNTEAATAKKTVRVSTKKTTIKVGKKKTIKVRNTSKFTVKSSKKKIATVKKSGKKIVITAKKVGKANITVKSKGMKSVTVKVTVKKKTSSNGSSNNGSTSNKSSDSKKYNIVSVDSEKLAAAQKAAGRKINVKFSDSDKDYVDGNIVILSKNDSIKYKSFYFDDKGKIIHFTAEVTDYAERIAIAYSKKIESFGSFGDIPKVYADSYKSLKVVYKKDGFWCFDFHTTDGMTYFGEGLEID